MFPGTIFFFKQHMDIFILLKLFQLFQQDAFLRGFREGLLEQNLSLVLAHKKLGVPSELVFIRYLHPLRQNTKIVKRKLFSLFNCFSH